MTVLKTGTNLKKKCMERTHYKISQTFEAS